MENTSSVRNALDPKITKELPVNTFYYWWRSINTMLSLLFRNPLFLMKLNKNNNCIGVPGGVDGYGNVVFMRPAGLFYHNPNVTIEYSL